MTFPDIDKDSWKRQMSPFIPDIPILFLYGICDDTAMVFDSVCQKRKSNHYTEEWINWVNQHPESHAEPIEAGHYMMLTSIDIFNKKVGGFLQGQLGTDEILS